jgi:hypothetical protein
VLQLGLPSEGGGIGKRPTSLGQLLGKSKREKPLADWIMATGIGLLGREKQDSAMERMERMESNDRWGRESFFNRKSR